MKEAILTWQMERALPKRRILALYLNVVGLETRTAAAVHALSAAGVLLDSATEDRAGPD